MIELINVAFGLQLFGGFASDVIYLKIKHNIDLNVIVSFYRNSHEITTFPQIQ